MQEFKPHPLLRNPHAMTIAANFWPRPVPRLGSGVTRWFEPEPGTQVRAECHWQKTPAQHPTLVILHGLEGSCESGYVRGTAEKAWMAGFNVVRLNQRNCGGTEKMSNTLYHSGLSRDILAVITELIEQDGLPELFAIGFSMGGNLVLKMAGELGGDAPDRLRAVVAIAPALDLAACADALAEPRNFVYERHFVKRLKKRMRLKASLFPELFPLQEIGGFGGIATVRDFDDQVTARFCNFHDASDYYAQSSAAAVMAAIRLPTLIITSKDDPFVPFDPFENPAIRDNPNITLIAAENGGHCAFISGESGVERFWAEARIVEYCKNQSRVLNRNKSSTSTENVQAIGFSSEG
jgi:predicted alpha/beta-fold hydrolase